MVSKLFPDEERSAVVTAIRAPDGVDSTAVVKGLRRGRQGFRALGRKRCWATGGWS